MIHTQITPTNPNLFDILVSEYLEDMLDKSINLKINQQIYTGKLTLNEEGIIQFYNTHTEKFENLEFLCRDLIEKKIFMGFWDKFPEEYFKENPHILPQVEIKSDEN